MHLRRGNALTLVLCLVAGAGVAFVPLSEPKPDPAQRTTQRKDTFSSKTHGFAFRNYFSGSPLPKVLRDANSGPLKAVNDGLAQNLPNKFGLCGGMSISAADYYLAGITPPTRTTPPQEGSPLYEYLYQRQTDSMGQMGVMAVKFLQWMNLPDQSKDGNSTAKLSALELPALVKRVKAHQLVPLGLVLTSTAEGGKPWENHQVLVYGVTETPNSVVEFQIYDPNFPGDDHVIIRVTPVGPVAKGAAPTQVSAERIASTGKPKTVRGFFAMPYEPKVPPKDLSGEKPK